MAIVTTTVSEGLSLAESDALLYRLARSADDVLAFYAASVQALPAIGRPVTAADSVGSAESLSNHLVALRSAGDTVATAESVASKAILKQVVADTVRTIDLSALAYVQALAESLGVSPQLVAVQALTVLENIGVSRQVLSRMLYGATVFEAAEIVDKLLRFFSGDIADILNVGENASAKNLIRPSLLDELGVDETVGRILVLRVTAPESVNIDDASLTQMFFDAQLADLLDIAAMYVAPGDSFTVWNVNAVTGSVARYENYAFNSFAHFGQMYIGADENGLYELNGCNDEGDAIIARIKSGLAQLTESRFTMVRDAYVGMRSDGSFVLRVTTGEGETYNYKFDAQNMKTTRVPLGKGMRTRYMSFELISDGDDFDLESVEFIPLMSKRRV